MFQFTRKTAAPIILGKTNLVKKNFQAIVLNRYNQLEDIISWKICNTLKQVVMSFILLNQSTLCKIA